MRLSVEPVKQWRLKSIYIFFTFDYYDLQKTNKLEGRGLQRAVIFLVALPAGVQAKTVLLGAYRDHFLRSRDLGY